jgi:hypothetical protein
MFITSCKQDTAAEFVKDIGCYSDFSTVDWEALTDKYYRPNIADWDSISNWRIIAGFPNEICAEYWCLLQNARTDFHQKSLPLRAKASKSVINSLDRIEAMFDTVFVRCVSQEYYMRLFPEMYNETMKPAIDGLVIELANKQPK